nr:peptidyl-prolyl cis-trans isomerase CYP95 isoform X1 [Ipomoea trifida]
MSKKKVLVFLDICIDGDPFERMVFELFTDVAPKTAENFRALCTGEKGTSPKTGAPLHYKGTFFHHILKGSMAQAGDLLREDGNFGESIYGGKFPDESPKLKHDSPGLLSMAIADRDIRGSLFMITFNALHHLDRKSVVFGKLVHGHEVLKKIENVGNEVGKPDVTVKIVNSGELHEGRRKGKHKKSSKERRRKRRRYYTSDSDSSTDSETESSESDSDSDSYISSSTDTSSSSDDRRRKRKRSKREKYRRGKRRDRRRERRRKKRDKKLKRRPRSSSDSLSEGDSGSSSEEGDTKTHEPDGKHTNLGKIPDGNQSHHIEEREAVPVHQMKGEAMGSREREEDEFPKENGGHKNNDLMQNKSDKSPDRQPDVVDNSPSKSRFTSILLAPLLFYAYRSFCNGNQSDSPRRSVSRSASVNASPRRVSDRSSSPVKRGNRSPTRSVSGSPATGKRGRSVSESPSPVTNFHKGRNRSPSPRRLNGSPPRTSSKKSWKSASRSPVRSSRIPSRSPVRSSRRSMSKSPVRSSRRSVSRSPVRSSRRSVSRSPVRSSRRSVSRSPVRSSRRSVSRSPVRSSRRSVSRSSGRVPSRRGPSRSPVRAPYRRSLRSHSRSPGSTGRRERSPISDRGKSSSKSPSVDGSPKRIRRGRGFSEQYSFVRRYRSRSPVRSYRYGRSDCDRYRNGRSRSRSISRSPIRYRGRRYSRSPIRSRSPTGRFRASPRAERRRSPRSRSRSISKSRSSSGSQTPRQRSKEKSTSPSRSPPAKGGLVSYGDGSPDSSRD